MWCVCVWCVCHCLCVCGVCVVCVCVWCVCGVCVCVWCVCVCVHPLGFVPKAVRVMLPQCLWNAGPIELKAPTRTLLKHSQNEQFRDRAKREEKFPSVQVCSVELKRFVI